MRDGNIYGATYKHFIYKPGMADTWSAGLAGTRIGAAGNAICMRGLGLGPRFLFDLGLRFLGEIPREIGAGEN